MILRIAAIPVLLWAFGFVLFVTLLPGPADDRQTDAIVVLTGGPGRIQRGISLMQADKAKRMLVSGVDRRVKPHELAIEYDAPTGLFDRKIDLGHESVDTRSNASEAADWMSRRKYRSVRLVTTDWHMPRARFDLRQQVGEDVEVVADAVPSEPRLVPLLKEYNKYLLRRAQVLIGV
ncbi:MAG: YdcF family protein [Sphingomonadaceae bacterium]